uniref:Uncharacterized protein n=1 Tax=Ananas comosus var. bracteatus TaxID=296719 RepID=A0A6V7PEG1_ANACO|nr:unnamed protein product [Ananas comosus var. bracteatus]
MKRLATEERARGRRRDEGGIQHDYTSTVFPHYEQWRKEYVRKKDRCGVHVLDGERGSAAREPSGCGAGHRAVRVAGFGEGHVSQEDPRAAARPWHPQIQRSRMVASAQDHRPPLLPRQSQGHGDLMVDCAYPLLKSWERKIECSGGSAAEIRIDEDLRTYSADVISKACFGSSYVQGKEIFLKLRALQKAVSRPNFLPKLLILRDKAEPRSVETEQRGSRPHLKGSKRRGGDLDGGRQLPENNLLNAILRSASDEQIGPGRADSFVVDNCKSIYFAGHETTAVTATWC